MKLGAFEKGGNNGYYFEITTSILWGANPAIHWYMQMATSVGKLKWTGCGYGEVPHFALTYLARI